MPASGHRRSLRRRPPRRRRAMRLAGAVSLAVLTTAGLSRIAVGGLGDGIRRVDPFTGLDKRPAVGVGQNFLLVGTDGREMITPAQKERYRLGGDACHCTDTIMLAHLSADRSRLSVVSIPRDSYVRLPAKGPGTRPEKLNAAYAVGGPALTVRTVERLTGVHIDHYLELDFAAFMKTVDAVGGVPVCTARPLHDPRSGLDLPAGTTVLDGGRALQYVRSRYLDPTADLGRMQRQQRFVAGLVRRVTDTGVLFDPVRLTRTIGSALDSVRADKGLSPADLLGFGGAMRTFRPSSAEFTSVPIHPYAYLVPGLGQTVRWDRERAARLFEAIRRDRPLAAPHPAAPAASRPRRDAAPPAVPVPVSPGAIRVEVRGGERARAVAQALRATGFTVLPAPARPAAAPGPRTVIAYDPGWDRSARSLATALPGARLRPVRGLGPVLRVTPGRDVSTVTPVRADTPPPRVNPATGVSAVTADQVACP